MKKTLLILAVLITPTMLHAQDNVSARRPFGQHTVAFSGTPTFDAGTTENWKMTLTGNVTSSTLIGAEAGMFLKWEICQDNVGNRTFVWPSQLQNPITIVATANACTTEIFYYDGTNGLIPITTTSGGGGSGTVAGGTVGQIAEYTASTTVSSDSKLDDGNTNANGLTYSGTAGIFAQTYSATGTGAMTLVGKEGTCSGAAATFDVICVGDSTSHSIETSLNGGGFFPTAQHQSTSPTPHGIMLAETFPQIFAAPRGQQGQAFCEGATAADPGYCSLNLAGGANIIQNILPKVNHPTSTVFGDQVNTFSSAGTLDLSGSTVASSFRVENKAGLTVALNGGFGYDTTSNNFHAGMNSADSIIPVTTVTPGNNNCPKWVIVSGNIQLGDTGSACGAGGGSPALSSITNATTANSLSNGDNAQTWQWTPTTAGRVSFRLSEPAAGTATGTPIGFQVDTFSGSTTNPAQFCAQGTSNCWRVDTNAVLKPIGSASLSSPGSNKQILVNNGGVVGAIDFPDYHDWPAAANEAGTAAGGWDCNTTTPTATLRAGTNNLGAFYVWGASDTCQTHIPIPKDWDTSTAPSLKLTLTSTDTTSGHTIIMQAATSCSKGDGSTTDDVAFNTAQSFATVTLNTTASQQWDTTLSSITTTGCVAGGMLRIKVTRGTDTATNVRVYDMAITIPRLLVVQAN